MILPTKDSGVRPAGKPDECFYCHEPVGSHKPDCVIPARTVVIELKTWLVVTVPQSWDVDMINFYYNESSHCIGTEIAQIAEEEERLPGRCCTCFRTEAQFLREATEKDHVDTNWKNAVKLGRRTIGI